MRLVKHYLKFQGTPLWVNVYSLHMNKELWGDPEVFRPERFLDEKSTNYEDWLFPYGGGK